MSVNSQIEWTDATWNPVRGCKKVSPGCKHCYAERSQSAFVVFPVIPMNRALTYDSCLEKLTRALELATPRMIFVNSMSDLFQEDVPDDYIPGGNVMADDKLAYLPSPHQAP